MAGENVGVYGINQGGLGLLSANYDLSYQGNNLTITKALLTGVTADSACGAIRPTGKPFRPEALPSPRHAPVGRITARGYPPCDLVGQARIGIAVDLGLGISDHIQQCLGDGQVVALVSQVIVTADRWRYAPYLSRTTKEAALPGANPGVGRITIARDKRRITPLALCALPVPDDERCALPVPDDERSRTSRRQSERRANNRCAG